MKCTVGVPCKARVQHVLLVDGNMVEGPREGKRETTGNVSQRWISRLNFFPFSQRKFSQIDNFMHRY